MVRELRLSGGSQFVQSSFRETHGSSSRTLFISPVTAQVAVGFSRVLHIRPENGSSTVDLERLVGVTCSAQKTLNALTGRVLLRSTDVDELVSNLVDAVNGLEVSAQYIASGIN